MGTVNAIVHASIVR